MQQRILKEGLVRMEFRDLKRQYAIIKDRVDYNIAKVIESTCFIGGQMVDALEDELAMFIDSKHCITCANGTDALLIALMAWGIGKNDAVFVPDFTFFSSGEVVSTLGATPIFVDVRKDTFNIDAKSLEEQIRATIEAGRLNPKAIIAVDLFGQTAEYDEIANIGKKYGLYILEDGAQGFGGRIGNKMACSFGDIATTSFFPAKPLGCYGDGGAIFTNNDEWAEVMRSIKVHGKGTNKYDNVRIGMNSRLDSIQAAVLNAKLPVFINEELINEQEIAYKYTQQLKDIVKTPVILNNYISSWAQYTIKLDDRQIRDGLQLSLRKEGVPTMIYYSKPMHRQKAFMDNGYEYDDEKFPVTNRLCDTVLSIPFHPYLIDEEISMVCDCIKRYINKI